MDKKAFSAEALELDCSQETEESIPVLREVVLKRFKKRGVVVALSGGIDSSVVGALCVRAFGKERVLGLLMPEKDSARRRWSLAGLSPIIWKYKPFMRILPAFWMLSGATGDEMRQ